MHFVPKLLLYQVTSSEDQQPSTSNQSSSSSSSQNKNKKKKPKKESQNSKSGWVYVNFYFTLILWTVLSLWSRL